MTANTQATAKIMNHAEQSKSLNSPEHSAQIIGSILVKSGRLTPDGAERIHHKQRESNLLFGETGISMGLISNEDVQYAITKQFEYTVLKKGESAISENVVCAYHPFGRKSEAFRQLRTHLLLRWLETDPAAKSLSVVSTCRQEGRSYVAANLAVSFSQLGYRVLLVDTDLRNSSLHKYFGLSNRQGLSSILAGKGNENAIIQIPEIRNLSFLPAGPLPPNPQELLSQTRFSVLLEELSSHFDLVILDTPASRLYSDAAAVSSRSNASILVTREGQSKVGYIRELQDSMVKTGVNLLGSVLLEF
ncbi:MAG: polysaccharide biosynthesis tyrosine autokinase [Burkholderiales bacterium]|jgi:receptor protein-tyrosine kinase|uniref:polysaccharide biosynthesis tyrosine autokinase n=1 Tax=Limnobacter sp. TaxID=2003368 RepID=UPI003955CB86|nr:polysaccharide biosynthesis tyrosine autokinase [Burkholderiales bacterium]